MSAVIYDGNRVVFDGNVFEDEVIGLREFINKNCEQKISFDLENCTDMHTSVVQLLLSCKSVCSCDFIFNDRTKPFAMAIDGFAV
jgi:hypothetical protein